MSALLYLFSLTCGSHPATPLNPILYVDGSQDLNFQLLLSPELHCCQPNCYVTSTFGYLIGITSNTEPLFFLPKPFPPTVTPFLLIEDPSCQLVRPYNMNNPWLLSFSHVPFQSMRKLCWLHFQNTPQIGLFPLHWYHTGPSSPNLLPKLLQ